MKEFLRTKRKEMHRYIAQREKARLNKAVQQIAPNGIINDWEVINPQTDDDYANTALIVARSHMSTWEPALPDKLQLSERYENTDALERQIRGIGGSALRAAIVLQKTHEDETVSLQIIGSEISGSAALLKSLFSTNKFPKLRRILNKRYLSITGGPENPNPDHFATDIADLMPIFEQFAHAIGSSTINLYLANNTPRQQAELETAEQHGFTTVNLPSSPIDPSYGELTVLRAAA